MKTIPTILRSLLAIVLFGFLLVASARFAYAQEQTAAPTSAQSSADRQAAAANQPAPEPTQKSAGEDQEENANLKYAAPVQWLARMTGLSAHRAYMLALSLNFAIIIVIVFWAARKFVPGMLRNRNTTIQQALQEARAASQDANRRLDEIENRLRQLAVEIGQMQARRRRVRLTGMFNV